MTYDRDFSISKALQKTGNPAAKVITQYEQTLKTITINTSDGSETIESDATYGSDISVSKNDLKKLNDNDANVKFAGVFGLSESGSDIKTEIGVQVPDNDYYPIPYFYGFSDCGAEAGLLARKTGKECLKRLHYFLSFASDPEPLSVHEFLVKLKLMKAISELKE